MKKIIAQITLLCGFWIQAQEPTFKVSKIVDNGTAENRVNFVIMGDGYTKSEIPTFIKNAKSIASFMHQYPPYSNYASYINIYAVEVISNESGTDEKDNGIQKDTYLNSGFNHDMGRLLTADSGKCTATAARHVPEFDQVIILVNTPRYGGSGGYISVSYNGSASANMNIHEVGHSFAGLADEYTYGQENNPINYEPHQRNVTIETNRNKIKWNKWIDNSTPVPTLSGQGYNNAVGLFEGGFYRPKGVYRPQHNCMMNSLYEPFCKICKETHITKFHQIVNIIDSHTPQFGQLPITDSTNFYVKPVTPSTHNMNIRWFLNGVKKSSAPIFSVQPGAMALGKNKVKVVVNDPQPDVKYPVSGSTSEVEWNFTVIDTENQLNPIAVADSYTVAKGKSLEVKGIGVTANDYDLNGDLFTASLVSSTSHGTLTLQSKGNFTYTPSADFSGEDSFSYKINDGSNDSQPATVTIKVIEKNINKDNFSTAATGFFTTLNSPLGTFTAPANFFQLKELNKVKHIKVHPNTNRTSLTLNLSEQLRETVFTYLHFNLEQEFPDSTEPSVITVEAKSGGEWATIFSQESIYPESSFSVQLESKVFETFRFTFTSDQSLNLYSVSLESSISQITQPITVDAHIVHFDLDGKGTRIGGGRLAQQVLSESAATAPKIKAKPGYRFTGWSTSLIGITSDITIRALYEKVLNEDELSLELKKGWNFISIPLKNANLAPLLKATTGKCWKWSENNVYTPVTSAESQEGLWIPVNKDKTVTIKGEPTVSETIHLKFGWNAYGPYKNGTIPEGIEAIFAWEDNKYKQLNQEEDKLERGKAYWIFSTNLEDIELRIEP